jgi:hypothetical protein
MLCTLIQNRLDMKKILTITLESDRGIIATEWGDGVTANDVIAMCEYAEGEAQYELDSADIDDGNWGA